MFDSPFELYSLRHLDYTPTSSITCCTNNKLYLQYVYKCACIEGIVLQLRHLKKGIQNVVRTSVRPNNWKGKWNTNNWRSRWYKMAKKLR